MLACLDSTVRHCTGLLSKRDAELWVCAIVASRGEDVDRWVSDVIDHALVKDSGRLGAWLYHSLGPYARLAGEDPAEEHLLLAARVRRRVPLVGGVLGIAREVRAVAVLGLRRERSVEPCLADLIDGSFIGAVEDELFVLAAVETFRHDALLEGVGLPLHRVDA